MTLESVHHRVCGTPITVRRHQSMSIAYRLAWLSVGRADQVGDPVLFCATCDCEVMPEDVVPFGSVSVRRETSVH